MAEHNLLGEKGERIAAQYLESKGYQILAKNYRLRHLEIDIVCQQKDLLVVVEVKTRSSPFLADPELTVSRKKQGSIVKVANHYCKEKEADMEVRFDIISIVLSGQKRRLEHIEDAFYPLL